MDLVPAPSPQASATADSDTLGISFSRDHFPADLRGKRVLLATESLGPVNGVSRTTLSLIEYLRENGVNVAVVAPQFDDKKLLSFRSAHVDIRLHGYPLPYNPDLTVVYPFRLDRIWHRIFQPDIVYLASPASVGFQFLLQIRQLHKPPVVLLNFQTDLSSYSEIIFPAFLDRYSVWLLGIVQGFLFSHRAVHTIFYPSAGIRHYLEKVGVPSNKMVHLGRGVDTTLFDPTRRDEAYRKEIAPNGEIILVCVSRLAPEKGFEFLAQVVKRLCQEGIAFKLVIVGGNRNPSVEEDIHRLFDQVKDNVIFTGFLTGIALGRVYASCDLFLHCSITETFGLVVLESMASGVPVVARDQGGPSEIVRHNQTGYLVPPQDLDQFVTQVSRLIKDTDLRSIMSLASRRVADHTTWEKINRSVAWHLADALQEKQLSDKIQQRRPRPIRNWLVSVYYNFKVEVLLPLLVMFRLNIAVGIVFIFWMIAVMPLLLHGNRAFVSGAWRRLSSLPLMLQQYCFGFPDAKRHC